MQNTLTFSSSLRDRHRLGGTARVPGDGGDATAGGGGVPVGVGKGFSCGFRNHCTFLGGDTG